MSEPHINCSISPDTHFYRVKGLKPGMVVRPVRAYSLDWTLRTKWWSCIVERVTDEEVILARPFVRLSGGVAMVGLESLTFSKDSDALFVRMID